MKDSKLILKELKLVYPALLILILLLVLFVVTYLNFGSIRFYDFLKLLSSENIQEYILQFGPTAPFIFVLLQILQVVAAPIPGSMLTLVGGVLFGTFYGSLLSLFGSFLGSLICFKISQKFGRPIVKRIIGEEELEVIDNFFHEKKGLFFLFILRIIPFVSFDVVSYGIGLTNVRFRDFVIISFFGLIPSVVLFSYMGDIFLQGNPILFVVVPVVFACFIHFCFPNFERTLKI